MPSDWTKQAVNNCSYADKKCAPRSVNHWGIRASWCQCHLLRQQRGWSFYRSKRLRDNPEKQQLLYSSRFGWRHFETASLFQNLLEFQILSKLAARFQVTSVHLRFHCSRYAVLLLTVTGNMCYSIVSRCSVQYVAHFDWSKSEGILYISNDMFVILTKFHQNNVIKSSLFWNFMPNMWHSLNTIVTDYVLYCMYCISVCLVSCVCIHL